MSSSGPSGLDSGNSRRRRLDSVSRELTPGNLGGLHASANTHSRVRLSDSTAHTAEKTSERRGDTGASGVALNLGSSEKENSSLGRSLDPGPGDESLVDCAETRSVRFRSLPSRNSHPVTPPLAQTFLSATPIVSERWEAI